jgi:hypothetical protein
MGGMMQGARGKLLQTLSAMLKEEKDAELRGVHQ